MVDDGEGKGESARYIAQKRRGFPARALMVLVEESMDTEVSARAGAELKDP